MKDLRDMAKAHGYSEEDISKAEACLKAPKATAPTKKKQVAPPSNAVTTAPLTLHPEGNLETGKRTPALPPVYTTPTPIQAPVVEAPAYPAPDHVRPSVVVTGVNPTPEPKSSWAWDVLKYLGFIVLVGSALGIVVNGVRRIRSDYLSSLAAPVASLKQG
jgi:hypothetical protein